ncbi:hypothetical protein Tco_0830402 [Tanacetum coccineum]
MGICRFAPDVTSKERMEDVYLGLVRYIKITKKTVKNEQAHQKRTKRSQRIKAEARKSKTAVKSSQHGQQQRIISWNAKETDHCGGYFNTEADICWLGQAAVGKFLRIQNQISKSTSWDQIPTNIATAVICLTSNQKYNFSKLIFDGKQLDNVSVPLDHFPVNTLTSKVFSFMVKKGKHFSGKVTPLFATMLVQPTQDEGFRSSQGNTSLEGSDHKATWKQVNAVIKHLRAYLKSVSVKAMITNEEPLKKLKVKGGLEFWVDGSTRRYVGEYILCTEVVLVVTVRKVWVIKMRKKLLLKPLKTSTKPPTSIGYLEMNETIAKTRPTSTDHFSIKPLPKIDPKTKERRRLREDESETRIEADRLLAEKLQEQEREQFTIEERAKFLHDTIAAQRKFLAQQRSEAIRNKPPTKNQLRNQMMTYLKHVGNTTTC